MKEKIVFLFITVLCLCSIFTNGQEKAVSIVVLGSSTAAGSGPSNSYNTWVNRYRRYVQLDNSQNSVTNLARGGYRTYHIMPTDYIPPYGQTTPDVLRNITKALSYQPDAIIINLPSNDASASIPVADQLRNYDTIMAHANAANVPVWISTTQPRSLDQIRMKILTDMRDSTYSHFGDKAIDFWTDIATAENTINPFYNSGDNVHLNDTAHGLLFKRIVKAEILEFISDFYLQAEDYRSAANIDLVNEYAGNSGNGFIRFRKNTSGSVTYNIKAMTNKNIELTFRYSNSNKSKVAQVYVNGAVKPDTLNFTTTGSVFIWKRVSLTVDLLEGENSIEVRCLDEGGNACLDFISWDDPQVTHKKSPTTGSLSGIINIDCGSDQNMTAPNWNNFTAENNNSESSIPLIDSEGYNTGYRAYVYAPFSAVNSSGTTIPNASLEMPVTATSDSYYGHTETFSDKIVPTGGFIFENLDQNITYSFKIFGSRAATDNRDTKYTVIGENIGTANLNVASNTSKFATINNIIPNADRKIILDVEKGANNTNDKGFFYIGAIRITLDVPTVNKKLEMFGDKISVYPVPFTNKLSLTNIPLQSTVSVYSITGNKVFEVLNNKKGSITLNTSRFSTGIYILHVSDGASLLKIFKAIKR